MEYNYEEELKIDIDALDLEWLRQPSLYMKYADAAAKAEKARQLAKENLELTIAEQDKEARITAQQREEKITEKIIDSMIKETGEYKQASLEHIDACYQYNVLSAAVRAFDQRKVSLENLVRLWAGQYFAGPKEPRETSDMKISERSDDLAHRRQKKSLNNKKERHV